MKLAREIAEIQARLVASELFPITLIPASKSRQVRKEETERFANEFESIIVAKLEPVRGALMSAKLCLPDAAGYDESWERAWNELSSAAQSQVKAIRAGIEAVLAKLSDD